MSGRKLPKRAGDNSRTPPTNERVAELACLVIDPAYQLGPMDQEDIREALCELIDRRNAEQLRATLPLQQPKEAA